ncbi:MAG: hypothetical protein ACERKT_07365 [Acidobacteriota bacterium]
MPEGPYFVDELLDRSDVRASKDGIRTTLTINLFSADANCDPFSGATVDMWQCDAQGKYSDVSPNNTVGQTFLRGYQMTDSNGQVTFTTIFPGWYPGRTIHIHLKFRVTDGGSTTYEFSTQVFFKDSDIDAALATPAYARNENPFVTNANDHIYDPAMVVPLTGNVTKGFKGTVDVGLAGMPEEVKAADSVVSSKVKRVRVSREKGGRRVAVVTLEAGERVSADARLLRGGRLLSRKRRGTMAKGTRKVRLPIAKGTRAGRAVLRIVLRDRAGNRKVVHRTVRIPPKKRRNRTRQTD